MIINDERDIYGFTDLIIKNTLVNLLTTVSMWRFQDSILSISKPRNLRWHTSLISLFLHEIDDLIIVVFLVKNCMQEVFKKLMDNT
jgi:hypothetical protein